MSPHSMLFRPATWVPAAAVLLLSVLLGACGNDGKGGPPTGPNPPAGAAVPPGVPTAVLALAADAQVTVSWSAPSDTGRGAVATYHVFAVEDTARRCVVAAPATSCIVPGLTNKRTYTFRVFARNAYGAGEESPRSLTVVPLPAAPAAPQGVTATAGSGTALVTWTSPLPGTWVSVVAAEDPARACKSDSASWCRVSGLEFGKAYTFIARAHGETGASAPSSPSAPVFSAPTVPAAPRLVGVTPGDTQATVQWSPPADNGGDSIIGYEVTALNSTGIACTAPASGRQCVVGNLPANVSVSFRVRALNALGPGPSAASPSVTPFFTQKTPGPPLNVSSTPGDSQVTVTWTPPASQGASPILRYRVTSNSTNPAARCATTGLSCTVKGLVNGRGHTFSVQAINSHGEGTGAVLYAVPQPPPPAP